MELSSVLNILLGALLAFMAAWFWNYRKNADQSKHDAEVERQKDVARISALESRVEMLNMQLSPFWAAVQTKIAADLTHPSVQFQEMDALLRSLQNLTIGSAERDRLEVLLHQRAVTDDPEVSEDEKKSARLMIGVMEKVISEARGET
jgi:hypothetical protein